MKRSVNIVIKGPLFFLASFFFPPSCQLSNSFGYLNLILIPSKGIFFPLAAFKIFSLFLVFRGYTWLSLTGFLCVFLWGVLVGFTEILESDLMSFINFRKVSDIISLNIASAHHLFTPLTTVTSIHCTSVADTPFLFVSFCYSCLILGIFSWTVF